MGAAAIPLIISAGTSLMQAQETRTAGKIQRIEAETAAKQEELAVIQREADRKESLARAMASQTAAAGASGVSAFDGSPLSILQEDIRKEEEATQRDLFMTKLSTMTTRTRGTIAEKTAKSQASIGLISDFGKIAASSPSFGSSTASSSYYKGTSSQYGGSGQATVGL